mmetsp:Transcript_4659/g.16698  ORF Transcript_4659/g.16698 Transcript_4659/m.16698 type:complete len:226 (-) Transcript_4659:212-889(-)
MAAFTPSSVFLSAASLNLSCTIFLPSSAEGHPSISTFCPISFTTIVSMASTSLSASALKLLGNLYAKLLASSCPIPFSTIAVTNAFQGSGCPSLSSSSNICAVVPGIGMPSLSPPKYFPDMSTFTVCPSLAPLPVKFMRSNLCVLAASLSSASSNILVVNLYFLASTTKAPSLYGPNVTFLLRLSSLSDCSSACTELARTSGRRSLRGSTKAAFPTARRGHILRV